MIESTGCIEIIALSDRGLYDNAQTVPKLVVGAPRAKNTAEFQFGLMSSVFVGWPNASPINVG